MPSAKLPVTFDPKLTRADRIVLQNLNEDIKSRSGGAVQNDDAAAASRLEENVSTLKALCNPADAQFEPTVFTSVDLDEARSLVPAFLRRLLDGYIGWARKAVRVETDVVLLTHLIIYFTTSLPSAVLLYCRFTWLHAFLHLVMQGAYMGPYTLLKHQHIHMRGVLHKRLGLIDHLFPYVMDPLMGHSWNSYYYHHVKHHHVEGNGPDDLSSTIRYQRDSVAHFLCYVGRFYFLIWFDLPRYFLSKKKLGLAWRAGAWELGSYAALYMAFKFNARATTFVFLIPLLLLRVALMVGNWGQHAFVDEDEPDSDYRSSITVIDVMSNRLCFNDGYHTSHHLNPLRHWRDHPAAFLQSKHEYASQQALVFHNIDYFMITVKLLLKDYEHLAKCMVPVGDQISMSLEERVTLLKRHTRAFTEEEIRKKFGKAS
ncbi:hypothetical protein QBC46DRAFT_385960 [Diplogelasinospora grovesii]|uniref:Fatty acid desaturase domain-containing protein n=1 Tax=Diplogelasinospora grovesii TaxID=303347 RepID=A0AAN6S557_9PEZI|nr:hypothetical protein QBC46DRAFT_385960 [Diplogelasinospora grovesii]